MNILFIGLISFDSLNERNIYTDLLKELFLLGHRIYCIVPIEDSSDYTHIVETDMATILKINVGRIQKCNSIVKGINTALIGQKIIFGVKKHFSDIKFDLLLYPTPPITIFTAIKYLKKHNKCKSYLMLKDIFPQNAIDISLLKSGSLVCSYFRRIEKKLYQISDIIGCMSNENIKYVRANNPEIHNKKVELFPNSIHIEPSVVINKVEIRNKYSIPINSKVFIYGGNLGKPQGINYLIKCLSCVENIRNSYFIICGTGTEYSKIEKFLDKNLLSNVLLIPGLNKSEFDSLLGACDVGLIFLDNRFTIPNFPSRLLSYLEHSLPVIACTDVNSDIKDVIQEGGFGWWCESNNPHDFQEIVANIMKSNEPLESMGRNARNYLERNYDARKWAKHLSSYFTNIE